MTEPTPTPTSTTDRTHEHHMAVRNRRIKRWEAICPRLYADTDPNHPDIPQDLLKKVMKWEFDPATGGKGIGIVGPSGKCKTRLLYLLLKELCIDEGWDVYAVRAASFARAASNAFANDEKIRTDAQKILHACRNAQVLLFDDLGKERYTDRVEMELYDMLEDRTSELLPVMWTANTTADGLHSRLSEDRGEPIIRRLAEFSHIYTLS